MTDYGNVYRCIKSVSTPYLDPSKDYANWELNFARSNTTLPIGSGETFPDLETAWKYCENCRVAQGAYLHLNIVTTNGDFNETFPSAFSLDHQSGAQVSIIGDNENNIGFSFPNSNGLTIDSAHGFQTISSVNISGQPAYLGIAATQGAAIANLENVQVSGFGTAYSAAGNASLSIAASCGGVAKGHVLSATQSGSITVGAGIILLGTGESVALFAAYNGTISADGAELLDFADGAEADFGGVITIGGASISDCGTGAVAIDGGRILAITARFGTAVPSGIANKKDLLALTSGTIEATNGYFSTEATGDNDGSFIYVGIVS